MARKRFTKADITFHRIGYGSTSTPAVNVKVYASPGPAEWKMLQGHEGADRRFDQAWIDQHLTDRQRDTWWSAALEDGWEQLQRDIDAEHVWPFPVKVWSEGRSSGWAIIGHGENGRKHWDRDDVASWDAVAVARWGKFARIARSCADDVPYQYLSLIYANVYLPWREDEDQRLAKAYAEMRLSV